MSWALEEWKSELSSRAVQKIAEYESHVEKLKKERQQKQIQLDSLEVAFQKQNQKLEGERNENTSLKREAQNLTEACGNLEKAQRRLSHEIQVKEALVCSLEGQLLAARKQNDNQEQEIKRLVAELERSQRASTATAEYHLLPSSTKSQPELSRAREDLKRDELQEKHSREVEEKNRLVSEVKALKMQVQQLQYSSNKSHRESGPQQIRASTFSWQQDKTSPHLPESPARSPSSVFPWEQPKTAPNHYPRSPQPSNNKTSHLASDSKNDHLEESASEQMQELRKENQVLQCTMSELEVWVQSQEKEIKNHLNKLEEAQSLLEKSRGELSVKEQALSKSKDSLERAAVQQEQTRNKCAALEQKLKQVSEELNCQRQNAESVRRGMERKAKNAEKEYQQELADQQRTFCSLEHQHKQEKNQMNQEIQQLKTEHLALQAKINKMEAAKQLVDRELEEVKGKLHWAEKELAVHQKNGDDLQANLQSALKEKECISTWQEQSVQKIVHLETQLKKLDQQLALSQRSREEMKAENLALASKSKDLQLKLDLENKTHSEGTDLSVNSYELNKHGGIEGGRSDPNGEHDICRSKDGNSDHPEAMLGIRVEVEGKISDLMGGGQLSESEQVAKSVNLDPGSGGEMEEGLMKDTDVNLDSGISAGSQCSDKITDCSPRAEGKMGARPPEVPEEVKEELEANGGEDEAMMPRDAGGKGEGIGRFDQPTAAGARLGELELKLKEVEMENRALRSELDNAKQEFESKMQDGQKDKRTAAGLRRKLKQAAERRAAEAERASEQAAQIAALETALEQERAVVGKAHEADEVEFGGVSQPSAIAECGGGEPSGDVRILQDAASEKMRRLGQQIARLEGDKACVEEIIEAQDGAVNEKSRALLEYLKGKDAQSLELDDIASFFPNGLRHGSREKTEHKPHEENVSSVETAGEGETSSGVELLPERLESKARERAELGDRLREQRKLLGELQRKCDELSREKEEEGDAKRRAQGMFDDLQSRIHRETQQLTVALDAQSKNIEGLLQSLGEKELDIQVLNGRLQSALRKLSSLSQENRRLRAKSKTVAETSCARPVKEAVPGQDSGEIPQGDQIEGENSSSQSVEKLGQKPASSAIRAAHENTQRSEVETVERSEPGFHEYSLQGEVNPSAEEKGPSLNDPATQNVGEVREKQQQPPATGNGEAIDRNNDQSIEPGGRKASSTSSAGPPQGDMEVASMLPPATQAKRDVESRRQPKELTHEGSEYRAQNSQSIRSPDGLSVKVDDPAEGMMVLHAEAAQAEPLIKESGDSPATEEKSEEGLIEEVERFKEDFEEEGGGVNDSTVGAVRTLNGELNSPNDECAIPKREEEQHGSEDEGARRAADGSPRERENSETAIRSGEDLLGMSSEERKCLRQELGALREWKLEVLGEVAALEAERGSSRAELHSLQGSVLGMQSHVKTLQAERRALEDTVESLKHSQKHLYQELEQAHFEKSVLQIQGEVNPSAEEKGPSLNDPATQNVGEVREVVEKQQQPLATGNAKTIDRNNDQSIEPGGRKASSTSSAGPPQGDVEMASTLPPAAQAKRDVERRRQPRELAHEGSEYRAQNSQSIRSPDGLSVKVDDPAEGMMVLHAEAAQAEPLIKESGDSPTTEEKSEEVEGLKEDFEEEGGGVNDSTLGAVRTLNGELNSPNDECAIPKREEEQHGSEDEGAGRAANGSPRERENSETAIQSGEDLPGMSSDPERKCLRQELGALREWKLEVLGEVAALEAERGSSRAELHSLQGSVLGMQSHVKTLEAERTALEDTVESLKHSQKHLYQELEQAHFEKSVLQIQVETLQKAAVELNEEKINLLSRLKQRQDASEDGELSTQHLQRSGLHDELLPMTNHRQGTAEVTASQMHADLMALRQAVREKSEEVDRNLLVYTDLLEKHQDPETADETWSAVAEPGASAGGGTAVAGQRAVGRSVEEDQAETSRRSPHHGQPRGPSAGLNPAALAMKIDPAQLAERIRRSRQFRQHLSVAYDETEYEPYGLPDVVQKGFADIPSGSFCPHILRRGTLNSTFCPAQPDDGNTD